MVWPIRSTWRFRTHVLYSVKRILWWFLIKKVTITSIQNFYCFIVENEDNSTQNLYGTHENNRSRTNRGLQMYPIHTVLKYLSNISFLCSSRRLCHIYDSAWFYARQVFPRDFNITLFRIFYWKHYFKRENLFWQNSR